MGGDSTFGRAVKARVNVGSTPAWAVGLVAVIFALGSVIAPVISYIVPRPLPDSVSPAEVLDQVKSLTKDVESIVHPVSREDFQVLRSEVSEVHTESVKAYEGVKNNQRGIDQILSRVDTLLQRTN